MKRNLAWLAMIAMVVGLFAAPAFSLGPNLIDNGDFEMGNVGFQTDYVYLDPSNVGTWTLGPEQMYTIGIDPILYHSAWTSFGDHTTSTGAMMIVNSASTDSIVVWEKEVDLPECDPVPIVSSFPLYAAQDMLVGEVLVTTSNGAVCVQYALNQEMIDAGWLITETHVAVADDTDGIPQTKKGNPIPGQFPMGDYFDPGVVETEWYCFDMEGMEGELVVAAHAKIVLPEMSYEEDTSFCIYSDEVTEYHNGESWQPAIPAWVHPAWESQYGVEPFGGAIWIWNSYRTIEPVLGEIVEFQREFYVDGVPSGAYLTITADNGYEVFLNGVTVGSAQVYDEWRTSDLTEPFVNSSGWQPPAETYMLDVLEEGNLLEISGVNEYMGPMDGQAEGTVDSNPGGVAYELCVEASKTIIQECQEESAWGAQDEPGSYPFEGKNWATYIEYTPEYEPCETMYEFSLWAANAYPDNPADLAIYINGIKIDNANLGDIIDPVDGQWKQYVFEWDAEMDTSAHIEIVNENAIAWGADFVMDDISFAKK